MPVKDVQYEHGFRLSEEEAEQVRSIDLGDGWEFSHEAHSGFFVFAFQMDGFAHRIAGIGPTEDGSQVQVYHEAEVDGEYCRLVEPHGKGTFDEALSLLESEIGV